MRAMGVGAAKTGTHALAAALKGAFRTGHEPDAQAMLAAILAQRAGERSPDQLRSDIGALLDRRDLEISVSQINGYLIETMVELHPRALYLLTVRDALSWLRSLVNHQLSFPLPPGSLWGPFRDLRFDVARSPFVAEDQALRRSGLHSLEAYLRYWVVHTAKVARAAPMGRLMVISTPAIDQELPRIAEALGVAPERLGADPGQRFALAYAPSPVDEIDPAYLDSRVRDHTARLWEATQGILEASERERMGSAIHPAPA